MYDRNEKTFILTNELDGEQIKALPPEKVMIAFDKLIKSAKLDFKGAKESKEAVEKEITIEDVFNGLFTIINYHVENNFLNNFN